jgi:hypothetical protein
MVIKKQTLNEAIKNYLDDCYSYGDYEELEMTQINEAINTFKVMINENTNEEFSVKTLKEYRNDFLNPLNKAVLDDFILYLESDQDLN